MHMIWDELVKKARINFWKKKLFSLSWFSPNHCALRASSWISRCSVFSFHGNISVCELGVTHMWEVRNWMRFLHWLKHHFSCVLSFSVVLVGPSISCSAHCVVNSLLFWRFRDIAIFAFWSLPLPKNSSKPFYQNYTGKFRWSHREVIGSSIVK